MSTKQHEIDSDTQAGDGRGGRLLCFVRARPVTAAAVLLVVFAGTELATGSYIDVGLDNLPGCLYPVRKYRCEELARTYAELALEDIGHDVEIASVEGRRNLDQQASGRYEATDKKILFSVSQFCRGWGRDRYTLLATISHECAHAVLWQSGLTIRENAHPTVVNADEMAAEVLGAQIGGRVADRLGWDGHKFELVTLALFRVGCVNPALRDSDQHYGSVEVMNGMHEICVDSPDVWTAAHRIAEKYFVVDESGKWTYRDGLGDQG